MARGIHIRQWRCRAPGVLVQVMLQPDVVQHKQRNNVEHHQQHAEVLVVAQYLDKNGQHCDQEQVQALVKKQALYIKANFKIGIAGRCLHDHGCNDTDQEHGNNDDEHRQQLGSHECPIRGRCCIDDFMVSGLAFSPHQFCRIVDDDHQDHEREGCVDGVDHCPCDGQQVCAVHRTLVDHGAQGIGHCQAQDNDEWHRLDHAAGFERHSCAELGQTRADVKYRQGRWFHGGCCYRLVFCFPSQAMPPAFACRSSGHIEAEQAMGQPQHGQTGGEPDDLVV